MRSRVPSFTRLRCPDDPNNPDGPVEPSPTKLQDTPSGPATHNIAVAHAVALFQVNVNERNDVSLTDAILVPEKEYVSAPTPGDASVNSAVPSLYSPVTP